MPLSEVIKGVLEEAELRSIRLGELIDRTADRGYGLLLMVLGLPMLIPFLPPGSSTIVGPIYSVFAIQMLSGSEHPWVPQRFRRIVLTKGTITALRRRGVPLIQRAERLSRPRGLWVSEQTALRSAGVIVLLMGLILLSPLPFLNTLPAISVMLIGMGLLNRDAVFVLAGIVVGIVTLGLVGLSVSAILILFERLRGLGR